MHLYDFSIALSQQSSEHHSFLLEAAEISLLVKFIFPDQFHQYLFVHCQYPFFYVQI